MPCQIANRHTTGTSPADGELLYPPRSVGAAARGYRRRAAQLRELPTHADDSGTLVPRKFAAYRRTGVSSG